MSIYYCERCGETHDADFVGCAEDPEGDGTTLVCLESLTDEEFVDYLIGGAMADQIKEEGNVPE